MDPISVPVIVWAGLTVQASAFLKRVAGPVADELGEWARDEVRAFRHRNLAAAAERAAAHLAAEQVTPIEVPLRTLLPIFEGASREDDPGLAGRWAALLANAAHPDRGSQILPIFPQLLSQLAPLDARLLGLIAALDTEPDPDDKPRKIATPQGVVDDIRAFGVRRERILLQSEADAVSTTVSLDTLLALGLLRDEPYPDDDVAFLVGQGRVAVSALGQRFLAACESKSQLKP